jgi:hypothetical protein
LNREHHNVDVCFMAIGKRDASAHFENLQEFTKIEHLEYEHWIAIKGICRGGSAGGVVIGECSLVATFKDEKECRAWAAKKSAK